VRREAANANLQMRGQRAAFFSREQEIQLSLHFDAHPKARSRQRFAATYSDEQWHGSLGWFRSAF
jgi:hypothetical protein